MTGLTCRPSDAAAVEAAAALQMCNFYRKEHSPSNHILSTMYSFLFPLFSSRDGAFPLPSFASGPHGFRAAAGQRPHAYGPDGMDGPRRRAMHIANHAMQQLSEMHRTAMATTVPTSASAAQL